MDDTEEAEKLRIDDDEYNDEETRREGQPGAASTSIVAQTTTVATYPTAPQRFYAMTTGRVFGPEIEGGAGTVTTGGSAFYAFNLGSAVPASGTNVLATFVDNRWVFRFDG